jgi:endonuclease/exonuclease/phosphatase family metal-dependent hydrolase
VQWCRGIDGRVDPARIASQAKAFDADVICLQEIASNFPELEGSSGEDQPHAVMQQLAGYEGFLVTGVDVPTARGGRARFGNLILTRLRAGRALRHSLPWPAAPKVPTMPRVAVEVMVQAPFGWIRILTTHLEYYSASHRTAQIERLREIHAEASSEKLTVSEAGTFKTHPRPVSAILCGDFNLPPQDPLHARVKDIGFLDAWEALNPGHAHPHTFRVHEREKGQSPYCCDYVFVTPDLAPRLRSIRIDGDNKASDHQPVIVELE